MLHVGVHDARRGDGVPRDANARVRVVAPRVDDHVLRYSREFHESARVSCNDREGGHEDFPHRVHALLQSSPLENFGAWSEEHQ